MKYKFITYNVRADRVGALVEEELYKDGQWKLAFVTYQGINILCVFERVEIQWTPVKETVTSEPKPAKKSTITVDE